MQLDLLAVIGKNSVCGKYLPIRKPESSCGSGVSESSHDKVFVYRISALQDSD